MVFLFVVLMIAITASIEFSRIKNRYMSSLFTGQSLIAYGDSNNSFKIDEIDHVLTSVSDKFRNPISADFEEFSNNSDLGLEVAVELYPYLYLDEIEISDGMKDIKPGEMVCPKEFYPYSLYRTEDGGNYSEAVIKSQIIDGESLIGQEYYYESDKEWDSSLKNATLKIVGTYDNKAVNLPMNACFINRDTFDEIKSDISAMVGYIDENGEEKFEYQYYNAQFIIVDDVKNRDYVIDELANIGFTAESTYTTDSSQILILIVVPLFIFCITAIIVLTVIYNFIRKKITYYHQFIGVLKSLGYSNKEIIRSLSLENIVICFVSYIITLIIYSLVFYTISTDLFAEFYYSSFSINIPYLSIIILFVVLMVYIVFITKYRINRLFKNDISVLLKED